MGVELLYGPGAEQGAGREPAVRGRVRGDVEGGGHGGPGRATDAVVLERSWRREWWGSGVHRRECAGAGGGRGRGE